MALDKTVDGSTEIAAYDFLKVVNQHFGELAGHYISMFQIYHLVFASIAMNIVLWGGIAWVAVLAIKAPLDRMLTAAGGLLMIMAGSFLLTPNTYTLPGAYEDVDISRGAGWTYQFIGSVYQLFKEGLDSITDNDAFLMAFENAYHVTDEETLKRFLESPMEPMYVDYINLCQPAFEAAAGRTPEARAAGRYVGFYGSGGIGQAEVQWEKANSMLDKLRGTDPNIDRLVTSSSLINRDGGNKVREGVLAGVEILRSIPIEQNPFDGKTVPLTGYRIPTKAYWDRELFGKESSEEIFHDASDVNGNNYRNAAYSEDATLSPNIDTTAAYPKNCYDLYRMVDQGERNWQASIESNTRVGKSNALGRDGRDARRMMYVDIQNQLRAENRLHDTPLQTLAGYGQVNLLDYDGGMRLGEMTKDTLYTKLADTGSWFKQSMLKYVIPMTINICAIMVAFLIIMFPLICVMAMFISPKLLVTFVKLLTFLFIVPFTNDACLSMGALLLAVNGELLEGYNAGNFTRNNVLLISAGTAEYIVFAGICVIELIFGKMLIWDDVKGMGNFNPGGAATGLAATGAAVIGATVKLGSVVAGGRARAAMSAAGASNGQGGRDNTGGARGSQASTKMAQQQVASGRASGGRQPGYAGRMSGGRTMGDAPAAQKNPGFLTNPVPGSGSSPLARPHNPQGSS